MSKYAATLAQSVENMKATRERLKAAAGEIEQDKAVKNQPQTEQPTQSEEQSQS